MKENLVIAIASGSMNYEALRGRSQNLLVRNPDGSVEPLHWYDKSYFWEKDGYYGEKTPIDTQEVTQDREGLDYLFNSEAFSTILQARFSEKEKIRMLLLINSYGGTLGPSLLLKQIADFVRERAGTVSSYATSIAVSTGAGALMVGDDISVLQDSWLMWHLPKTSQKAIDDLKKQLTPEEVEERLRTYNQRQHILYKEQTDRIIEKTAPEFQAQVRADVERVMSLKGVRHELRYTGADLHRFGIAREAFAHAADLEADVEQRFALRANGEYPTRSLYEFFAFAKAEEQMRKQVSGIEGFRIRKNPNGKLGVETAPGPENKPSDEAYRRMYDILDVEMRAAGIPR